jgi:hypothetical protein
LFVYYVTHATGKTDAHASGVRLARESTLKIFFVKNAIKTCGEATGLLDCALLEALPEIAPKAQSLRLAVAGAGLKALERSGNFFRTLSRRFRSTSVNPAEPTSKIMKTKSKISAYIARSAAVAVLFSCAIVGLTSAFNSSSKWSGSSRSLLSGGISKPTTQTKTLTFAERVAYQRAIEEVYRRPAACTAKWNGSEAMASKPIVLRPTRRSLGL